MYAPFFGLKQEPFSIAPDPRYLYMSERHREALAHLLYGLGDGGGFVLLSGEIGTGKTTVCRCFLEQIPKRCNVAYIFNPKLTVIELLRSVCEEFRIPYRPPWPQEEAVRGPETVKDYLDPLNKFLLRTHAVGQNNVLIIDEAQMLEPEVLEQLRLLTNLETNERKLLQIILIGQPELRTMLARPDLEQLAQRVIARFHLDALTEDETAQYVAHRLAVAGRTGPSPFSRKALRRVHALSRGVPRRINLLCDRALLGAYAGGQALVDSAVVDKAALEVFDQGEFATPLPASQARGWRGVWRRRPVVLAWALGLGGGLLAGAAVQGMFTSRPVQPEASPVAAVKPALGASAPGAAASPASGAGSAVGAASASAPLAASTVTLGTGTGTGSASIAASAGTLAALPAAALIRDEAEAWRELAGAWNVSLPANDAAPCQSAQRQQLWCYRAPGASVALIRQLGRPGIVSLRDDRDQPAYALLTGLDARTATLRIGGRTQTVTLAALAERWRGDFSTYWRAPSGYRGVVGADSAGPVVDSLAAQLASVRGEAPPAGRPTLDAGLRSRVYAFQLAQGLKPDGIPGPTTFMQLNRAVGLDEPKLAAGSGS